MTWNYRMFHRVFRLPVTNETVEEYTIREAYYNDAGKVTGWSAEPDWPIGETKLGLMEDVTAMAAAISLPVIELTADGSALNDEFTQ